jgi:VanZ family protein
VYILLAIVVALIVYGTLYPFHFDFSHAHGNPLLMLLRSWPSHFGRAELRDAILNVALFVPLGAAACLAVAKRHGRAAGYAVALALGSALSAAVEMLQVYDASRFSSAMDWLCNTIGTFTGAAIATAVQPRVERLRSAAARRGAPAAILLAVCWMGYQAYPLIPQVTVGYLRPAVRRFITSSISPLEVFAGTAAWFVFALALQVLWPRLTTSGLALAMVVIPLRLFITDRTLSLSDLLAGAFALLLWAVTPAKARLGAGWLVLFAAIIVREMAPFHFGRFHAFSWSLFGATIGSSSSGAVVVILRKAFEYGAAVWLLRQNKIGYLTGGVCVAAALAAMEAIQCFLPGRTPEITDPALALLMALILRLLDTGR